MKTYRFMFFMLLCGIFFTCSSGLHRENPDLKLAGKVKKVKMYKKKGSDAFFYKSGMKIDADGSPRAYHPDNTGLDDLKYAGRPGNWWALVVDKESMKPVIQGPDDPAPGYYVSRTSLSDTSKAKDDPSRYVNAEEIPYIVLPKAAMDRTGADLGDFAYVVNKTNGKESFAIFADVGPPGLLGEGSMNLAENLGIDPDPRMGGTEYDVIYLVFPDSGNGKKRTVADINRNGSRLLKKWGRKEELLEFYF